MATPPVMAAPQQHPRPHVGQYTSTQPVQNQSVNGRIDVKRQVAKETERQLLFLEALLQLSQDNLCGMDLSALVASYSKLSRPETSSHLVGSARHSKATAHQTVMQPATLGPSSAEARPAATFQATPCASTHVTQKGTPARFESPAMPLHLERQAAGCSSREAYEPATGQSTLPSSQDPAHQSNPGSDKGPENAASMSLRRERKRSVLLLDEGPERAQTLTKTSKKEASTPGGKLPAETPAGFGPDLQNASQHIVQRRGVYFKIKEKAFEAQLDTARYRKNLAVEVPGPNVWYLGLFRVTSSTLDHLRAAQDRATKTVDRARVKLLEGMISLHDLRKEFPLEDYFTEEEIADRKDRTMKDYCNLLKHNADARRAQHGGKGVAARRRTNGGVSYEARISKHTIGTFGTYSSLEEAKYAYDVGAIICKGTDYRLNYHLSKYMTDGVFLPSIHVPEPLKTIIQAHVNGLSEAGLKTWLTRVQSYYQEGQCPFHPPSPNVKAQATLRPTNRLPFQGWSAVAKSTAAAENVQLSAAPKAPETAKPSETAEKVPLSARPSTTTSSLINIPDLSGADGYHKGTAHPTEAGRAALVSPAQEKEPVDDRMVALLAGTATEMTFP